MCGIAGIVCTHGKSVELHKLRAMTDQLAHRGPDGEGHWMNDDHTVGLGHRRLSIIDLSHSGDQPMHLQDKRYTIVFNGEIYNYIELRTELIKKGYRFNSNSDTEVLLALFDLKGEKCLGDLDGMFAFAIWDDREKKLFCARDRFGEKPFYYYFNDSSFIFASEIKALKAYLGRIIPDSNVLQSYLLNGRKVLDTETSFQEIQILPPATSLVFDNNKVQLKKYWEIHLNHEIKLSQVQDYVDSFDQLFQKSIARRLRSDVPYGSSLSGGLDSSTVVGYIHRLAAGDFTTFSARFDGPKDEGKWIEEVIRKTGLPNKTVYPDPMEMINEFPKLIRHHEYPIATASIYAQWCVMKLVSQNGVKVLLDGQGADEYLAGYDELKYFALWELYRSGKIRAFLHERNLFNKNYGTSGSLGWSFLADPILSVIGKKRAVFQNGMSLKEQLRFYTLNNLGELLRYADRNSMAHSIEVRLPFLSHELVQFVFNLPSDLIYREGKTKFILREAARPILPEAIYNRTDKIGFAPPQESWMMSKEMQHKVNDMRTVLGDFNFETGGDAFRIMTAGELLKQFA
ncbi:asparagine synthase (glutamine-hydrolyzing) [soil metagenome]